MWEIFKPQDSVWYCWHFNGAAAYLNKSGDMWQTAFKTIPFSERTDDFGGPETENPPEELPVTHVWGKGSSVFPHPYLSSQPYMLKFMEKTRIAPGEKACFTAALPPVIKYELTKETILAEAMPLVPKQTFLGADTMNGKFGHSLNGALLPKQPEEDAVPSVLIHCDIVIKNHSKTMIEQGYFTVIPEPLNVYACGNCLIADTMEFEISGTEYKLHISHIKNNDSRLISAGVKSGAGETFVRQSVGLIKNITKGGM